MLKTGIDLGGTKIEIVILDENSNVLHQARVKTPQGDYAETLKCIKAMIDQAELKVEQKTSIGIGTPGAIAYRSGLLKNSNSICLNGMPFKQDLENLLKREIRISNDANCFALSEATDGAAAGASSVFGVIVGTGTGAGIVINQRILEGSNRIAGEWGHNPLPWPQANELPGPSCYCGLNGCIETFLSGPALEADFLINYQQSLSTYDIVKAANNGDQFAEQTLQRYENRLARALASIINIIDPEIIVLGGGLSNLKRLYKNVPEHWKKYVFSDVVRTQLIPPLYGDASGVRGAARLWQ